MILRSNRDELARLLRHLAAGVITNDQFDDGAVPLFDSRDPAIEGIYWEAWGLYSDLRPYRLRGRHALSRDVRRAVARCVLFLHSDFEYVWPLSQVARTCGLSLLVALGLGVTATVVLSSWIGGFTCFFAGLYAALFIQAAIRTWRARKSPAPEPFTAEWPFASEPDLQRTLRSPRLLRGAAIA